MGSAGGAHAGTADGIRPAPLNVQVVQSGLEVPWDLAFIDPTHYLVGERAGQLWLASTDPAIPRTRVAANFSDLKFSATAGLMGMVVDPKFATNRTFYTCQSHANPNDVRVVRWRLSADGKRAFRVNAPVLQGIPFGTHHWGCRLLIATDGTLYVGTGDGGIPTGPQSLDNLAGKILRVNLNGSVPRTNPYAAANTKRKYVWNWGHRNVQGLAQRPGSGQIFSAEHGPAWDDEVNLVLKKRNYGWNPRNPAGGNAYYQQVPMTDLAKYPNAVVASWSSGPSTVATSGMTFVTGSHWGAYDGAAFVALLKDTGVLALTFNEAGGVTSAAQVPELNDTYGRIRTITRAPDGSLYVLTSNEVNDSVLRVTAG